MLNEAPWLAQKVVATRSWSPNRKQEKCVKTFHACCAIVNQKPGEPGCFRSDADDQKSLHL